jgi:hypothetical protein
VSEPGMRLRLLCLVSLGTLSASPALAGPAEVRRCGPTPAKAAAARVQAIDAALKRADLPAAQKEWEGLQRDPCFALAQAEETRVPAFDDLEAAQWWWEQGGRRWLEASVDGASQVVVLPPDWPKVLRRERLPKDSPLQRLVCATGDASCGQETQGWVLRANEAFSVPGRESDKPPRPEEVQARCEKEARAVAEPIARYMQWRRCLETDRPRAASLPMMRSQAPHDGWLAPLDRKSVV